MMNKIRCFFNLGVFFFLAPLMASATPYVSNIPYFEDDASPSLADHLNISHSKDPIDGGWLPDLTGLPDDADVLRMQPLLDKIMKDKDRTCNAIDPRLRRMVFQHFLIYQQMANAQHICLDSKTAHLWAHVLAMVLKESSGDSASITAMSGRSISTNKPQTNLERWNEISGLKAQDRIPMNYQTNFGLTQTSADRLSAAFSLAQTQQYDSAYLEGKEGVSRPKKIKLNTVTAIRRLIWFYQDFSQGRIVESDRRIHQQDISKPAFASRYQAGLKMVLLYCGTPYLFQEGVEKNTSALEAAVSSIAYCKLGNPQTGYGRHEINEQCFAKWVTLCPAMNIDIATLTPLSYFATRNASPVCEATFNRLINKNTGGLCNHSSKEQSRSNSLGTFLKTAIGGSGAL